MEKSEPNYKAYSKEDLLTKVSEEVDILSTMFEGEDIVLAQPAVVEITESETSTNSSGKSNDEDDAIHFAV